MTLYDPKEISLHNHVNSLWIVHKGNVYDVTEFAGVHPGGRDVLLEFAGGGEDAEHVMQDAGSHKHSDAAYNILRRNYIGKVKSDVNNHKTNFEEAESYMHHKGVTMTSENNNKYGRSDVDVDEDLTLMRGYKEDELIDWSQPLYWQVGGLGENYKEWVHNPVDKPLRLFHSDFCEFFSKSPWQLIPIVWCPVICVLIYLAYSGFTEAKQVYFLGLLPLDVHHLAVIFLSGPFLWSLVEYLLHRWLFHRTPPAQYPFLIQIHFIMHGQHHKCPFERYRLVFPPVAASVFAIVIYSILVVTLPRPVADAEAAGMISGYLMYDLTHYYLHHGAPTRSNFISKYFQRLKHYHIRHHFENQLKGFGVSSKFWDYPFNTLIKDHQS